jgi:uncharacterized protein YjbJ (UPF0337 family)
MGEETKDTGHIIEDVKGKAKEIVGDVLDDADMKQEGEAQQDKAELRDVAEQRKEEAAEKRDRAEDIEAAAQEKEAEQRLHQQEQ